MTELIPIIRDYLRFELLKYEGLKAGIKLFTTITKDDHNNYQTFLLWASKRYAEVPAAIIGHANGGASIDPLMKIAYPSMELHFDCEDLIINYFIW